MGSLVGREKSRAKIGAEMMTQRSLRGSAKSKVTGPPARSVAVRSSRRSERATGVEDLARKIQGSVPSVALAAPLVTGAGQFASFPPEARAELNQYEYDRGGEFNRGSAKQFGGIEMKKVDIVKEFGQDLRLSNFVQADIRDAKLRKANLRGAYMMKLVAPGVDFTGADMSDALMDRSVFVGANFTDAILNRVILTLSDLNEAVITGADFTDALLGKETQKKLCMTATVTNSVTGVSTRKSLKCGGSRREVRNSSPSRYMTDENGSKPKIEYDTDRFSMYSTKPLPTDGN